MPHSTDVELIDSSAYYQTLNDDNFTQSDVGNEHTDDNHMDRVEARGCLAFAERIPLWLKLSLMSSVFLVGSLVAGGYVLATVSITLQQAKLSKEVVDTITDCRFLMYEMSTERYFSSIYLSNSNFSSSTAALQILSDQWKKSNTEMNKFYSKYPSFNVTYPKQLDTMRKQILFKIVTPLQNVQFFESYTLELKKMISDMAKSNFAVENVNMMLMNMDFAERVSVIGDLGHSLFMEKFYRFDSTNFAAYNQALRILGQYESLTSLFRTSTPAESITIFDSFNNTNYKRVMQLLDIVGNGYLSSGFEIDASQYYLEWVNVTNDWQGQMYRIGTKTLQLVSAQTDRDVANSTHVVVWISLAIVTCFIIGMILALIMARTIVGPWRRLSKLQEATIRKFVPKEFMKLLNVSSITDMVLGKHVERDITMLQVEMKNMSTQKSPAEALRTLNDFLSTICPLVRKNGGFVDRYTGDGFTALFRTGKSAMQASVEIQSSVEVHNAQLEEPITVGITMHSAYALISTVGENERMDGVVLSKESGVSQKLQHIGDQLQANIIATRQSLSNRINHRFLGSTIYKNLPIEMYEVFGFGDALKRATLEVFNQAARAFDKKQFYKSKELFDTVLKSNQDDKVAKSMHSMCVKVIDRCEYDLHRMRASEMLAILSLRNALEEHCKKEFSTENIDLWKHIQTFRTMSNRDEMLKFAKELYDTYCDINGDCAVNITEATRMTVKKKLDDVNSQIMKDLFDKLNVEIVTNLEDTTKRFKDTDVCRELYLEELKIDPMF